MHVRDRVGTMSEGDPDAAGLEGIPPGLWPFMPIVFVLVMVVMPPLVLVAWLLFLALLPFLLIYRWAAHGFGVDRGVAVDGVAEFEE